MTDTNLPSPDLSGAVAGGPRLLLRLEGAALAVAAILFFAWLGASWWLFAGLILAPDLSLLGYLLGRRVGAAIYNAGHVTLGPMLLCLAGIMAGLPVMLAIGLVWLAHVGIDRAVGYGLKYPNGFGFTHLGRIGRDKS